MTAKRKEQVLDHLRANINRWVDGPDLANEKVGGSEGHRRIRELRTAGYHIAMRRHPDAKRGIWQYALTRYSNDSISQDAPRWGYEWTCETCGREPSERPVMLPGGVGLARCAFCRARRYFRHLSTND